MTWLLRLLLLLGMSAIIITYNIWYLPLFAGDENVIDKGWAVFTVCISFVVWKGVPDMWIKLLGKLLFWFSVNNLLDEFLFDPIGWHISEYIYAIIVTVLIIYEAWHKYRTMAFTQK